MGKICALFVTLCFSFHSHAEDLPSKFLDLLDFVQEAPNQGKTNSCLYVASTGAMELIANKKNNIRHPVPYGPYDLSEAYLIHAPAFNTRGKSFWEIPFLKFNKGFGISMEDWPYEAWVDSRVNSGIWRRRNWSQMRKVSLPQVDTIKLFTLGGKWSTRVAKDHHVKMIKEALWKNKAPVLVNYNDVGYWHVVLIVGYDDDLPGNCFRAPKVECQNDVGSFYVRDSYEGIGTSVRDYDWFKFFGNAAFATKEVSL